ncbi:Partitioning defective 3 B [Liparis tanakae]|uniref:Partitioning defective 3 B n=1 Tax=Liparis tanakae TaxID=230148 RepID=A0A4Z2EST6_9TELE|nr:Partitioning defective 3 B [Liparis tanakae]
MFFLFFFFLQEINNFLKGALDRLHRDAPPAKMGKVNYNGAVAAAPHRKGAAPTEAFALATDGRRRKKPRRANEGEASLNVEEVDQERISICLAQRCSFHPENIFQQDECIVHINDTPLQDKTFAQSQEVFRQAMTSPSSTIRLEVLPPGNKSRYEKTLIGQLFTADGKERPPPVKARSPMVTRARAEPEPRHDARRPDARAKTPETAEPHPAPAELRAGPGSLERISPTHPTRGASASPTPRPQSQSPAPGPNYPLVRKSSKKMKIDLKKGECAASCSSSCIRGHSGTFLTGRDIKAKYF